ncbi:MAG: FtsX-like permease family protein [Bdellovibrionaceae bacterium]|nr:FtsX-like permease family protein [Pseudobdellovibrionaceae bacterium]
MTWLYAFRNLFRNRRRSLVTGIAVLVGFLGLVLIGGFISRVEHTLRAQTIYLKYKGHLSIYRREGLEKYPTQPKRYQLSPADEEKIQEVLRLHDADIDWVGSTLSGVGLMSRGEKSVPFSLLAVDRKTLREVQDNDRVKDWARDFVTPQDLIYAKAVAGDPTAVSATPRLGESVGLKTPFESLSEADASLQLAGMTHFRDLNAVDAPLASSHSTGSEFTENSSLLGTVELARDLYQAEGVQNLIVFLKKDDAVKRLAAGIEREFREKNLPYEVFVFSDHRVSPHYAGTMGFLHIMSGFFIFLICGAVVLSIVNSLTMGILERVRELGTLRAVGFGRGRISWLLTQEALCLTTVSCALGAVLALSLAAVINAMNFRFSPPGVPHSMQFLVTPQWETVALASILLLSLTAASSYLLSYYKMKTQIINLLSDTGA